ncbi:Non-histone chromosomal protein 6 [Dimargaris cristalligena]|uniref:Non-histone chromosomal protein 6 n=1 Tax=Dimargaris cristalligena TaxID=215637 RepID=A0A4P9ZN30_9FUNG|nr:Non-histone chromosomal protein 6 [Dimargaris cristalligena]RKP34717.1 Non-histone chromosomal protein 6 [Dimargaris cristalligena]|eukprot:RKP34717.1 Non-histone chromosomal protein 6 [Dimargaris cristalligena]
MPRLSATSRGATTEKRKPRAKKDPNAPKRNLSAYMFYSQAAREGVKQANPTASFGELGKRLGEQWKSMSDTEKVPYEQQAAADKIRYENEKASYRANSDED